MTDRSAPFRQRLLSAQTISPDLQTAYQRELDSMLNSPMTVRSAVPGLVLLVALLVCTTLVARAALFHQVSHLMQAGYGVLVVGFVFASVVIIRDLRNRTHSRRSILSIANALTLAAGTLTVVALLLGLRNPSDPKSLFGAFYVFVFYFASAIWAIDARVSAAELSAREQSLRIEYRLAEIADRLQK